MQAMLNAFLKFRSTFFLLLVIGPASLSAQTYCKAGTKGAGNLFGGNIISMTIEDDTGILYSYSGLPSNNNVSVMNPGSAFKLVSWDELLFSMTGFSDSSGKYTKAGIWIDANRDGAFSASECIADPQTGPFSHITKDSVYSKNIILPGPIVPGVSRIRIRGVANSQTLKAENACDSMDIYGNQFDFEVNLFQGTGSVQTIGKSGVYFSIYPNPASDFVELHYNLPQNNQAMLKVVDFTGKVIFQRPETLHGEGQIVVNTASFEPGFYITLLESSNSRFVRQFQVVK